MKSFEFSIFNSFCSNGVESSLKDILPNEMPIIVCIGTDLVIGDCLAPLVGSILIKKKAPCYVYGTLSEPVTAKEVNQVGKTIRKLHPNTKIIAVDASLGNYDDIGQVRVYDKGLYPGLGVNKKLSVIGDVSILGIVCDKSYKNNNLFNLTRLNLVFKMAEIIADGLLNYLNSVIESDNFFTYNSVEKLA
jgi:putative sporulation protein YyaC